MKQFTNEEFRALAAKSGRVISKGNPQNKGASSSVTPSPLSAGPTKSLEPAKTSDQVKTTEKKKPPPKSTSEQLAQKMQKMATDRLVAHRPAETPALTANFSAVHPLSLWDMKYPHHDLVDKHMSFGQDVAMCAAAGLEFLANTLCATGNQITFLGRQLEIHWRAHQKQRLELKSLKEQVAQQAEAEKNFHAL